MTQIKFILFSTVISIFISGCSQPLRTLMDLGSEKNAQGNFVKKQNLKMDMLLQDIKKGRLKKGMSSPFIIARYGEPVLKIKTTFVYRNAVEFFHTPKVYLDFDEKGLLMDIRLENQHEGEIRAKQSQ